MATTSVRQPPADRNAALENYIAAIAAGERDALGLLYEETHTAVFAFALSIVQNRPDAEDVLQDVYLQIWKSAPDYQAMGKPLAWIFTITRNFALMSQRHKKKNVPVAPEDWRKMYSDVKAVDAADALVLSSVMGALEEEEREIVLLHVVAGLKHRETSALLNLNLSTVLSKYNRALKKLRQALGEGKTE